MGCCALDAVRQPITFHIFADNGWKGPSLEGKPYLGMVLRHRSRITYIVVPFLWTIYHLADCCYCFQPLLVGCTQNVHVRTRHQFRTASALSVSDSDTFSQKGIRSELICDAKGHVGSSAATQGRPDPSVAHHDAQWKERSSPGPLTQVYCGSMKSGDAARKSTGTILNRIYRTNVTRREWLSLAAIALAFSIRRVAFASSLSSAEETGQMAPGAFAAKFMPSVSPHTTREGAARLGWPPPTPRSKPEPLRVGNFGPVDIQRVAAETNINVTILSDKGSVSVESEGGFNKIHTPKVPRWLPSFLKPDPKVIKVIPNSELMVAAMLAGGALEMVRTTLLYPLQTIKTRIQAVPRNNTLCTDMARRSWLDGRVVRKEIQRGHLYAGITPSLLVSVPATGVYYGVRDVSRRVMSMFPNLNDASIILAAALLADIVSLCFRTPADTLAVRLQADDDNVGDWFGDSLKKLPSVIVTDLPYLLSKIALSRQFIRGHISIEQYTAFAILAAMIAAALTTPFDVARTRILVDSSGSREGGVACNPGVLQTMVAIAHEGSGGLSNLYVGWLERVLYLGIARALLEPLLFIGYIAVRDAVLLELF